MNRQFVYYSSMLAAAGVFVAWRAIAPGPAPAVAHVVCARPPDQGFARAAPPVADSATESFPRDQPHNPASSSEALRALHQQLNDPQQRQAYLNRALAHVMQMKSRLFYRLKDVPPETLDRLKTILAETELNLQERLLPDPDHLTGTAPQDGSLIFQQVQAECDNQAKALLGDAMFARYAAYQQSEPYRDALNRVADSMQAAGISMPDEERESLLDAYTQALRSATQDSMKDHGSSASGVLGEAQQQALRLQQLGRFDEYLAVNAARILGAEKFKAFMAAQYAQESVAP